MFQSDQLSSIVALAEEAGKEILQVYQGDDLALGVTFKSDVSPLTRADIASQDSILARLRSLTPELPVLSEESREVPYEERRKWETFWLVDPLDGTKEFIKRNGEFTVNIALIDNRIPILGVIHAPALSLTYYAARNEGAFRKKGGEEPQRIRVRDDDHGRLRIVASRSHAGAVLEQFLRAMGEHECVNMGSSLKFCLVGEGTAHLYPRLGPTMEWDTAAGQCIVEAAGGRVTTLRGEPLIYNKPELLNPSFIVSAGPAGRWQQFFDQETKIE